ncbi:MAG: DUF58 domain-containing protein [candidate division Zixibacteria bacterium]|nr:DUF58 domain-containing protein [candidate division Zixibacteria bacterium]
MKGARYFSTLPPEIGDAQFFRMLDRIRLENFRRSVGSPGGEHATRRSGASIEFAGHRSYDPGDDLRYLDWHLLARHDIAYTKTFQEQEYYHTHLLIDDSASMYGMAEGKKYAIARDMATALAYVTLASADRLYLARFSGASAAFYGTDRSSAARRMSAVYRLLAVEPQGAVEWTNRLSV